MLEAYCKLKTKLKTSAELKETLQVIWGNLPQGPIDKAVKDLGSLKTRDWKTRNWKTRHQITQLENAGPENGGTSKLWKAVVVENVQHS